MTASAEKLQQAERLIEEVHHSSEISDHREANDRTMTYTRHYEKQDLLSKRETKNSSTPKLSSVSYPTNSKTPTTESPP
jgi:hypothetical protein